MVPQQKKLSVSLLLAITLVFTLSIPFVLANHINFMDAFWTTGEDSENLSLNQGQTAELYVHVPFVPSGASFTFAVSAENDTGSQYVVSPSTRYVPYSTNIPLNTTSLAGEYEILVQAVNAGGTDVETLQLNVNTVPQIIVPASPITVEDGQLISFTVTGTDADKDMLTLEFGMRPPTGAALTLSSSVAGRIEKELVWTPSYSQVGRHTLTFLVEDQDGFETTATATIIVNPHNLAPEITGFGNGSGGTLGENNSITEGETLTAQVYASDADGDALNHEIERRYCIIIFGTPTCYYTSSLLGEMNFNSATGRFFFAPGFDFVRHPNSEKTVQLRFRVFDGEFYSAWREMTTTVRDMNQRPIADAMAITLLEDRAITLALPAHDNDAEDELSYELGGILPAHGDLSNLDPDTGRITYTPDANYSGFDSFTFVVEDDTGLDTAQSAQGTITLEIGSVNDLPTFIIPDAVVSEDFGTTTFNLRNYVSDVESAPTAFTFAVVRQTHPEVVACAMETAVPSFRLQCTSVANQYGSSEITIIATDGNDGSATDTFTLAVNSLNDPIAITGQVPLSTPEETSLTLALAHLLVEDPDHEYPAGFSLDVARGSYYTVSGTTITPVINFNGTLSVPVTVLQGGIVQGNATLNVTVTSVNDAPIARDDVVDVTEDNSRMIFVLNNDSDVDGTLDVGSVNITNAPLDGTVVINADGSITYTPKLNSFTSESFTYTVKDNNGALSNEARVVITLRSENDVPQLNMPPQSVHEDSGMHTYNLRDYASDVEDTPEELGFFISGESRNDIIDCEIVVGGFTLVCTTHPEQNGESFVDIRVIDSEGAFRFFPVLFTVIPENDAPVAESFTVVLDEDVSTTIFLRGTDPEETALEYLILSSPEKGTLLAFDAETGSVVYTPQANYNGTDSFTYRVKDESGDGEVSSEATVNLVINPVNDVPRFVIPNFFIEEDSGPFTFNLRSFAFDVENTDEQLRFVLGSETHAEIVDCALAADGFTLACTTQLNQTGSSVVTVQVIDSLGAVTPTAFIITVMPVSDVPEIGGQVPLSTPEETSLTLTLGDIIITDADVGEELFTLTLRPGENYTVDGTTITPARDFNGTLFVEVTVKDESGQESVPFTVQIEVTPVNDAPVANAGNLETEEDTPLSLSLSGTDVDGTVVSYNVLIAPVHGSLRGIVPDSVVVSDPYFSGDGEHLQVNEVKVNEQKATVLPDVASSANSSTWLAQVIKEGETVEIEVLLEADATLQDVRVEAEISGYGFDDEIASDRSTVFNMNVAEGGSSSTTKRVTLHLELPRELENDRYLLRLRVTDKESISLGGYVLLQVEGRGTTPNLVYLPDPGYYGEDSFTFVVEDNNGATSEEAIVSITVHLVNDTPVAEDDTAETVEETSVAIDVLANDHDVDGDILQITSVSTPRFGTAVIVGNAISYTPEENIFGVTDEFTYTIEDPSGAEAQATVQVTITALDDDVPQITGQRELSTFEDTPITLQLSDLAVVDPDREYPTGFSLVILDGEHYTFIGTTLTPELNFNSRLRVPVQVVSADEHSNTFILEITVTPVNDAPVAQDDAVTISEDTSVRINVLANDSDVDEEVIELATVISEPSFGTAVIEGNEMQYTPDENISGVTDEFMYTIRDPSGEEAQAVVRVTITAQNDAPTAENNTFTLDEDTPLTFTLQGSDSESPVTFSIISGPNHGTLSTFNTATGEVTYTPEVNYFRTDNFVFEVSDGGATSALATISLIVNPINDAPVAQDDSFATEEDEEVEFNVRENDTDVDNNNGDLMVTLITSVTHGTLTCNPDGECSYMPQENFTGTDNFTYTVSDGTESDDATVIITVDAENDAPLITGQVPLTTAEDTSLTIALSDLLVTDVDALYPAGFTLEVDEGNNYTVADTTITPEEHLNGTLEVPVRVSDGNNWSEWFTARVQVLPVNDVPVAHDQVVAGEEDTPKTIHLTGNDVEDNLLTFALATTPTHGILTGFTAATGEVTYTPQENFTGEDSFTFTVSDGSWVSLPATVSITIGSRNDAPQLTLIPAGNIIIAESETIQVTATATDVDSASSDLSFSVERIEDLTGATFINGIFSWTPNVRQAGTYQLTFVVTDETGLSDEEEITLIVQNSPQIPVALGQTLSLAEDTSQELTLTGEDRDGSIAAYTIMSSPVHGRLTGIVPHLLYTPAADFNRADSFTFTVRDNDGLISAPATVSLTIIGINDAPRITSQPPTTAFVGEPYIYQITVHDDGTGMNYSLSEGPEGMTLSSTGQINWTPTAPGTFPVTLVVSDGELMAEQQFVIIIQKPREDLQIMNIQLSSEEVQPGDVVVVAVSSTNKGEKTEKGLEVQIAVPELGLVQSASLGTLKSGRSKEVRQSLLIPYDAGEEESYLLVVTIRNDHVHESEYRYIYMQP